ncbi:MAG: D-2-hydroxyacid dehydrogenase [Thermoanaerobacteraceae bacterium]|nr:D-2-hydroxyacid dehydrogenase [Thermoanaerobacteraceae bacterium]
MTNVLINVKLKSKYLEPLREAFPNVNFVVQEELGSEPEILEQAEVLVTFGWTFTPELARQAKNLKWVQALRAGVDNFPIKELKKRGIIITTVKGIHGTPMAEHAMGMILAFSRGLMAFRKNQFNRVWDRSIKVYEIYDQTMGIVGVGNIGREIAKRAKAFGMKTLGINTSGSPVTGVERMMTLNDLPELLRESDYVIVTLPLTDRTNHLFKDKEFQQMKSSAYFINLARGDVVDETALIRALRNKEIAGAALDVFSTEPLPEDSPLWEMENVIITPHLAALSPRYMERAMKVFRKNLEAYLQGQTLNNVMDWEKGY